MYGSMDLCVVAMQVGMVGTLPLVTVYLLKHYTGRYADVEVDAQYNVVCLHIILSHIACSRNTFDGMYI